MILSIVRLALNLKFKENSFQKYITLYERRTVIDPTTAIVASATSTTTGGLGGILLVLVVVIIPFVVKFWNWSKETSAQGMLYTQLSELVQKQREELDTMYVHRTVLQEQVFELRNKVEHLTACEDTIEILKKKLDLKDDMIADRDARIAELMEELIKMKDRVHALEMRLKEDEARFGEVCNNCKHKGNTETKPNQSNRSNQHLPPLGDLS